eukprot:TRINITY_DN7290_c1_g2_i1.p1 TRINITY_DN7290_c1_g2~~TRINITY_DN7290_c1_g2_i1.p1  ORF type:complete len:160 (-),score=3.04 TRINITY_DN7290_c1_g2_i1:56-508(-)
MLYLPGVLIVLPFIENLNRYQNCAQSVARAVSLRTLSREKESLRAGGMEGQQPARLARGRSGPYSRVAERSHSPTRAVLGPQGGNLPLLSATEIYTPPPAVGARPPASPPSTTEDVQAPRARERAGGRASGRAREWWWCIDVCCVCLDVQ